MSFLKDLIGRKIVAIRPISKKVLDDEGWDNNHSATSIIELDDGTLIYPSMDDEGNGPGTMFGVQKNGTHFYVWSKTEIK